MTTNQANETEIQPNPAEALAEAVKEVVAATPPTPDPLEAEKAARLAAEAEAHKERRKAEKLQERVNRLSAEKKATGPVVPPANDAEARQREIEAKASELAENRAAMIEYNRETGRIVEKGKKEFPDFLDKVSALKNAVIDPSDSASPIRYKSMIDAIMETADGDYGLSAKLIHSVGTDPDLAEELSRMSPVRLGRELAKLAEAEPPTPVSKTPKPPSVVVGGRSPSHTAIDPSDPERGDRLSTADWMARRNAEIKAKREAGARGIR